MESPSRHPQSGRSLCNGLLITASILSCWIQATSSQDAPISVVPSPPYGIVGHNVTLTIQGFSDQALSYTWYRKTTEASNSIISYRVLTGRQTKENRKAVLPNGSLLISNLSLNDTDRYIVEIVDSKGRIIETEGAQLSVYAEESDFSISGEYITAIVILVLTGVALIGGLVSSLFFRKTEGGSKHLLTERKSSAPNHSQTHSDSSSNEIKDGSHVSVDIEAQQLSAMNLSPEIINII